MPADDSHVFLKKRQDLKLMSAANYRWPFMGKDTKVSNIH